MLIKRPHHIWNCSGGKDSVIMLEEGVKRGMRIDQINFADVGEGGEFPQQYEYLERVEHHLGIKINVLKSPKHTVASTFYGHPESGQFCDEIRGFNKVKDPGCRFRSWLKTDLLDAQAEKGDIIYIGFAADEPGRVFRSEYTKGQKGRYRFPLMEWGITEAECYTRLQQGELHNPLYQYFSGLGCFWCGKQPMTSKRRLYWHFPEYWARLRQMQLDQGLHRPYLIGITVLDLEEQFEAERRNGCTCHLPPPHQCAYPKHYSPLVVLQKKGAKNMKKWLKEQKEKEAA